MSLTQTMQAITYANYGPPDVLRVATVPRPEPGNTDVLIQVHAAEATKADCEMRSFHYSVKWFWLPLRIAVGLRKPRRQILGAYFCGEIAAVGRDVSEFQVGDQVFGSAQLRGGAYGEYMVLPASYTLARKPHNMSFAEAAAVPLGGLNALHFMRRAKLQPDERVLINGAGGSIGLHAVQIARAMGAHVTAVDAEHKEQVIRRAGAQAFIDYQREDFTAGDKTWDVIFDMVPSSSYSGCLSRLNSGGCYLVGNPRLAVMLRCVGTKLFGKKTASFAFARETVEELTTLSTMVEEGAIASIVETVYPMSEAALAHRRVESEQRCGALVIAMGEQR